MTPEDDGDAWDYYESHDLEDTFDYLLNGVSDMKAKWTRNGYCPLPLRTVAAVLAAAKPAIKGDRVGWWRAGGDWWGVDPAAGVLPVEIMDRMADPTVYDSDAAAMAALRQACDGLTLDGFGRVVK